MVVAFLEVFLAVSCTDIALSFALTLAYKNQTIECNSKFDLKFNIKIRKTKISSLVLGYMMKQNSVSQRTAHNIVAWPYRTTRL